MITVKKIASMTFELYHEQNCPVMYIMSYNTVIAKITNDKYTTRFVDCYFSDTTTRHQGLARAIVRARDDNIMKIWKDIISCKSLKDLRSKFGYCPKPKTK